MPEEENNPTPEVAAGEDRTEQFNLQRIYLKDLSFESPRSPNLFREKYQPQVNLELNVRHNLLGDDSYEVVLNLTVNARNEQQETLFLIEVQQAGIFSIKGMPEGTLHQALGSYCPSVIFPYARETIDNVVIKGGLPPLMLAPVNFDAVYKRLQQHQAEQNAGQTAEQNPTTH